MRTFIAWLIAFFAFALIGCNSQTFPGGPGSTGTRDVPFSETYLFDFKTGAGPISRDNPDGNLQIISAADLLTLLAAAQDQQLVGFGVVSGLVLSNGSPVQDVALKVTDADGNLLAIRMEGKKVGNNLILPDGLICPAESVSLDNICIKGSIYYNSPGGVPDFSNNKGTSVAGTYTIFNLPPGEVYLWASRGGRGNARIKVFADKISVGKLQVIPIAISTVGVTGSVIEAKDESTAVAQATVSVLGTDDPGLTTMSDANGLYSFVSIGTNGNYLLKVSKPGHWDSYHSLNTTPFQATVDIQDVTKTVSSYSNSYLAEIASQGGVQIDSTKGVITGRITGGDGTPQHCAKLSVRDAAGNDLSAAGAVIVYVDGSRGSCEVESDTDQTSTNGLFFIYNVPPGEVFVSYFTRVTLGSGGDVNSSSGGMIVTSFPGVAFVQNITNSGTNTAQKLSGSIIDGANSTPVSGAQLTFLGITSQTYSSDSVGDYNVPTGSDLNNALIGGRAFRVKISEAGHADTYEIFTMTDKETKQNLILSPISTTTNPVLGEIYGLLIDQVTGQTAENVTLRITDLNGNSIAGGEITSSDGIFRFPNVPPGMVNLSVISGEDSGNATLYVYPNGVTYFEFIMTKVIPSRVSVSGKIKDLANAAVGESQLRAIGKSEVLSADGNGDYQGTLESFARFIIKTEKDNFFDTYNYFPRTGILNSTGLDLFSISRAQISNAATQAGIVQSSANGLIVGTTIRSSFSQEISSTALGAGPHAAALGFFNKDSILDIAITNPGTPGTVTVLFGSESVDGGFGSPSILTDTDGIGDNPSAIAVADFDGNGSADLVVANKGDHSITVLRGDKNGNFTAVAKPIVDAEQQEMAGINNPLNAPVALVAGFFDSDTFADIAVVNEGDSSVIVLLGNGNGTFHPIVQNTSIVRNGVGDGPKAIVAGDFNQDQRMDMAISNSGSGTITVLLGSTDGTFQPLSDPNSGSPIAISAGTDPQAMELVDLNSDGRLDLAVINRSANTLTVFVGNTSGGFDRLADANQNFVPPIAVGSDPSGITVGEFNGDGRADLAIVRQSDHSVLVLFGNGDGTFTLSDPIGLEAPLTSPEKILLSDQNRDSLFDLVIVGSHVGTLLGREDAIDGVSLEARDMNGARVGEVRYLDNSGQIDLSLNTTSAGGGFIIFNVPPGLVAVRAINGGVGNAIIDSIPDAVSYTRLRALSLLPSVVSINGVSYDPVGPPPAGVPVGGVNIQVLGMDVQTQSDANSGNYSFHIDANGEYILRLCWDLPNQPCQ
jgi:hypothetical protein